MNSSFMNSEVCIDFKTFFANFALKFSFTMNSCHMVLHAFHTDERFWAESTIHRSRNRFRSFFVNLLLVLTEIRFCHKSLVTKITKQGCRSLLKTGGAWDIWGCTDPYKKYFLGVLLHFYVTMF